MWPTVDAEKDWCSHHRKQPAVAEPSNGLGGRPAVCTIAQFADAIRPLLPVGFNRIVPLAVLHKEVVKTYPMVKMTASRMLRQLVEAGRLDAMGEGFYSNLR